MYFGVIVISYPGHFVPKSFRTVLVISYPLLFSIWSFRTQFGHFVPISYPVWSFRSYFYYFLEKPFWSFRTYFLLFHTQVISYPKSFRTHFSHFVPGSFRTHFQTRYELTWVRNDFLFCCNLVLPDCFVPKSFRTRSHFVPILVISYLGHFVPTSKLGTN